MCSGSFLVNLQTFIFKIRNKHLLMCILKITNLRTHALPKTISWLLKLVLFKRLPHPKLVSNFVKKIKIKYFRLKKAFRSYPPTII